MAANIYLFPRMKINIPFVYSIKKYIAMKTDYFQYIWLKEIFLFHISQFRCDLKCFIYILIFILLMVALLSPEATQIGSKLVKSFMMQLILKSFQFWNYF